MRARSGSHHREGGARTYIPAGTGLLSEPAHSTPLRVPGEAGYGDRGQAVPRSVWVSSPPSCALSWPIISEPHCL